LLSRAENSIVVVRTNKVIAGFGECSPFMTINGESMETAFVVARYLANALKGKNPKSQIRKLVSYTEYRDPKSLNSLEADR
jgi:hypothetical protein